MVGRYKKAIKDSNRFLRVKPSHAGAVFNRARARLQLSDLKGFCSDLHLAFSLGHLKARSLLDIYCKN